MIVYFKMKTKNIKILSAQMFDRPRNKLNHFITFFFTPNVYLTVSGNLNLIDKTIKKVA